MSESSLLKCCVLFFGLIIAGCATNGTVGPNNNTTFGKPHSYASQNGSNNLAKGQKCPAAGHTKTQPPSDAASNQDEMSAQEVLDSALEFCQASNDYWQRGDLENAIDALDQAYSLILTINSRDASPEILQQKDDLRFTISKRIAEVYASRFTVANGDHKAIPLDMNPQVKKAIELFQGCEKTFFWTPIVAQDDTGPLS